MSKQHGSITEVDGIHEPKGASTASADTLLVADGAGSTSWKTPSELINETYTCVYLDPQNQQRTFSAGDVGNIVPFTLTYTSDLSNNLIYSDIDKTITYTGTSDVVIRIVATFSVALIGIGSPTLEFFTQRSTDGGSTWVTNNKSRCARKFSNNDVGTMMLSCLGTISAGDKLRLAARSDSAETFEAYNVNFNIFGFTVL